MSEYKALLEQVERELYDALQALEDGDLPTVRSCTARAENDVIDAWKVKRAEHQH